MDALELLSNGTASERISAANTLKYAIGQSPLNPILEIWYAAKDLINPSNPLATRTAGWELLTECARHFSSTDLERREFFQTLSGAANPEDFHLQLAALVDLTRHGRLLAGFDYDLLPVLTLWLQKTYTTVRNARKSSHSGSGSLSRGKSAASGEEKNLAQLFSFLLDVLRFGFNTVTEVDISRLIEVTLAICMNANQEDDVQSCIDVLETIVTFGSIPQGQLKDCVRILSCIYCLVPNLEDNAWKIIDILCKSHNGQATVRILLDILRNPETDVDPKDATREIRGSLAVLRNLLARTAEDGYPDVPFAVLVDGLNAALKQTKSLRVYLSVVKLINFLLDDGEGKVHPLLVGENWTAFLEAAAECCRCIQQRPSKSQDQQPMALVETELLMIIRRLDVIAQDKSGDFVPRQIIMDFFASVHEMLPDETARTVLDFFQEFRCCSPSDLKWEENLNLVLEAFFRNQKRNSDIRLRALDAMREGYEIVELVGDGEEQNFIPKLATSVLQSITEECDIAVLDAVMSLMVSVVNSCDAELFDFIVEALKSVAKSDRLRSPVPSPFSASAVSPTNVDAPAPRFAAQASSQSASNIVATGYVRMFLRTMNSHSEKSAKLFSALVGIAKNNHCEADARLTAMKLLFRLRANWASRVFVTDDLDNTSLAAAMCRTDASIAKKQAEDAAQSLRLSRSDHGAQPRASRGFSLGQSQIQDRGTPSRTLSGGRNVKQHQLWKVPDPAALPEEIPRLISPVLVSHLDDSQIEEDATASSDDARPRLSALDTAGWLDAVLEILRGSEWEIYSFALVHLPSQLSNYAIFNGAVHQIQELRRIICDQIRTNSFQEPPFVSGLRRADVAICLFHSLTMILSYHEHFGKGDEDEIVKAFILGIGTWERTAKYCIHAVSICCHELPLSASKSLVQMLNQMAAVITQPHVSVHILEFLACLSRLHKVYVNFREDEYRIVFGICFRYLEYARDKSQTNRNNNNINSEPSTPVTSTPGTADAAIVPPEELPEYVHALAYHVILFWFLALKLPDRATQVGWIVKKLLADSEKSGGIADDQVWTSIDFMQRVTYANTAESSAEPLPTEERFGQILKKQWLIGNSIVTVQQATGAGWAQVTKRQPSGTSSYTIREALKPPPPQEVENLADAGREGHASTMTILPSHLVLQLMAPVPQGLEFAKPILLPDEEAVDRAIRVFDRYSSVDSHKVGVIYIAEGQTDEAEILANMSGSRDYSEFLNSLGTLTKLKGATFNTQGLDREYDSDGEYTFCWRDRVTEMVFHVTTQMPTNLERDPQCTMKKRHIGNDFVNIIFNDSGKPFKFDTFPSQFNYVNIVVTPASWASFVATRIMKTARKPAEQVFYRVQVLSKPGFPEISPASEAKMVSLKALPGFIRLLALNASVFCHVWNAREGGELISSWNSRLLEIRRLRDRYGPKSTASSNPSQSQPSEPSRAGNSVRDSLISLRRSSVATFFTSTSEQTSHRSSTASTSTKNNETEVAHGNVVNCLVESADFSKWT